MGRLERFLECLALQNSMGPARARVIEKLQPGALAQCQSTGACSQKDCAGKAVVYSVDSGSQSVRPISLTGEGTMEPVR